MNEERAARLVNGTIVRSDRLHGVPFGTIKDVRKQFRTGQGWGEYEYLVGVDNGPRFRSEAWIDENQLEPSDLDWVIAYYRTLLDDQEERIKKLRGMVGKRVPKFNPTKHLEELAKRLCDAYRHEDGSITYVFYDPAPGDTESPRTFDGNVATLIQESSNHNDLDDDDAGLREARERFDTYGHRGAQRVGYLGDWAASESARAAGARIAIGKRYGREDMVRRYIAMFRPDILHYEEHWSVGQSGSYGWGYVTRANWEQWMGEDYQGDVTPEQAFEQEVKVFGEWAEGEVYGSCHIAKRGAEPDEVFGHLGYADSREIAAYHTESPILEVLA